MIRYDNNIPLEALRELFLVEARSFPQGMKVSRCMVPHHHSTVNDVSEDMQEPTSTTPV